MLYKFACAPPHRAALRSAPLRSALNLAPRRRATVRSFIYIKTSLCICPAVPLSTSNAVCASGLQCPYLNQPLCWSHAPVPVCFVWRLGSQLHSCVSALRRLWDGDILRAEPAATDGLRPGRHAMVSVEARLAAPAAMSGGRQSSGCLALILALPASEALAASAALTGVVTLKIA
eukprot:360908-Chlamydomonas_euryale.AAC.23